MYFVSSLTEMSIFRLFNLGQPQLRLASESIQLVLIIWVGVNSNKVRLMKSLASEAGLNHLFLSFRSLNHVLAACKHLQISNYRNCVLRLERANVCPVIAVQCGVQTVWANGLPVDKISTSLRGGQQVPRLVQLVEQSFVCLMYVWLVDDSGNTQQVQMKSFRGHIV